MALRLLYQADLLGRELVDEAAALLRQQNTRPPVERGEERDEQEADDVVPNDQETRAFALRLVQGVRERWDELDATIRGVAQNWDIARMAVIDRNVLRLATYELLFCRDIPPKVAINEAIELGKRYSTANSGAFINGILDKIKSHREAGGEGPSPATEAASGGAQG
jgi:N utilization substance protein B